MHLRGWVKEGYDVRTLSSSVKCTKDHVLFLYTCTCPLVQFNYTHKSNLNPT